MKLDHSRLHDALASLAPPKRFQLLLLLLGGVDRSVSALAAAVKLSQSCTSRHLQALERAGLVRGTRDGKRVVFRALARDAEAVRVLAAMPGGVDEGTGSPALAAPGRTVSAGGTRPASREAPPPGAARVVPSSRGRFGAPIAAALPAVDREAGPAAVPPSESGPAQAAPESGNKSPRPSAPEVLTPRFRRDIEDYLL